MDAEKLKKALQSGLALGARLSVEGIKCDDQLKMIADTLAELDRDKPVCYKCKYDDSELCYECKRAYRTIDNFEKVEEA